MLYKLVLVYSDEEAALFGKSEAGEIKISYASPLLMKCLEPKMAMLEDIKGLYNKFVRGLDENSLG